MKYLMCLTRNLLAGNTRIAMTRCEGSELLRDTHCAFCEYYIPPEEAEIEHDKVEDPVIFEKEEAEWAKKDA